MFQLILVSYVLVLKTGGQRKIVMLGLGKFFSILADSYICPQELRF